MKATDRAGNEWLHSPEDEDLVAKLTWHVTPGGYVVARDRVLRTIVRFHRLVAQRLGFAEAVVIDHQNREPRDNTRGNLRPATRGENSRNRAKLSGKAHTKYIGVSRDRNRFVAYITYAGNREVLGYCKTAEEAAAARDARASQLHGEFACLNRRAELVLDLAPRRGRPPPPPPKRLADCYEATDSRDRKWWFSEEDLPLYWQRTWHVWTHPKGNQYIRAGIAGGKDLRFHREVLRRCGVVPSKEWHGDHIDGDGRNNRRENLRAVTPAENARNSRKRKTATRSQYKGVDYNPKKDRYLVSVQVEGEKVHVGTFVLEEAAGIGYDLAVLVLMPRTGRNFPHLTRGQLERKLHRLEPRRKLSSRYVGVSWHEAAGKWEAYITHRRERHWLGLFETEQAAFEARMAKAAELTKVGFKDKARMYSTPTKLVARARAKRAARVAK